jgi:acyl carrier protein
MIEEDFLAGLKIQFEESDAVKLKINTKFKELDTWDSLTRFSIIAFIEDDYKITLTKGDLEKLESPLALLEFVIANEAKS